MILLILVTLPISVPIILRKKRIKRQRKAEETRGHSKVNDLRRKLWEGFGQITAESIPSWIESDALGDKNRAVLSYELARWHAARGNWDEAADQSFKALAFSHKIAQKMRPSVLLTEALIQSGRLEEARKKIDDLRKSKHAAEMKFAECNLLLAEHGTVADIQRLKKINKIYREAGLEELQLIDEEQGFVFGNLDCQARSIVSEGPTVSVFVPVYNSAEFLDTSLGTLRNQTWKNLEIIIVDDNSQDDSWARIQQISKFDKRIKAVRNDQNMGAYFTRNRALGMATGEFVTVHDSDDWLHPRLIEWQVNALQKSPHLRGIFGTAVRVCKSMRIHIRPDRDNLEYLHRSYPSFMAKRTDVLDFGQWDSVLTGADNELVKRFETQFGKECIGHKISKAPLTLQLHHDGSLTQASETALSSMNFGLRRTYEMQSVHWREQQVANGKPLIVKRENQKEPFPVPELAMPKLMRQNRGFDLVLISDMTLLGGTRRCNEGYIAAATAEGLRVGLFNYPRWDFSLKKVASGYLDLCRQANVELLTKEDQINAAACIVHHPPILKHRIDMLPRIKADRLGILVNQSPMQLWSETPYMYDDQGATDACQHYFDRAPEWIAISNRVKTTLSRLEGYDNMYPGIWHPPYSGQVIDELDTAPDFANRPIRIGRHSRDHWTKWPADIEDLQRAYCAAEAGFECHILGGISSAKRLLPSVPRNWVIHEFDDIDVTEFIDSLDVFVNFMHYDYIEEFGRNTMEAMARGKPVILEHGLKEIFGESALYCAPGEVAGLAKKLIENPVLYLEQSRKGISFVKENCAMNVVRQNLVSFLGSDRSIDS